MKVEQLEKNRFKITFEVDAAQFQEALRYSYNKNKGQVALQGFRRGKAPRKMIEAIYGQGFFYEDAFQFLLQDQYDDIVKESGLDTVSAPEFDVETVDEDTGVVFNALVYTRPNLAVTGYLGLSYDLPSPEVTEGDVDAELEAIRQKNSRTVTVTDRAAQNGDILVLDYTGRINEEMFEGGYADEQEVTLGSHTLIDTFEEQLVGCEADSQEIVTVRFPEDYHSEFLAGKEAVFNVTIHEIRTKELPDLDDDFAQDVSEFDTLREYRESLRQQLAKYKQDAYEEQKEQQLIRQLIQQVDFTDVPEVMYEEQTERVVQSMASRLRHNGLTLEMYLRYTRQTQEAFEANCRAEAEGWVKGRLILESIARQEQIIVTQEDAEKAIEDFAQTRGLHMTDLDADYLESVKKPLYQDLYAREALKLLINSAVAQNPGPASAESDGSVAQ
jgi:trigger factor